MSKGPLNIHNRIIIILPFHRSHLFTRLIIIRSKRIDEFRICKRQFSAKVRISGNQVSQRISTVISRQHNMNHRFCQRFYLMDYTRPSFVQNQYYRLSCCRKCSHQLFLIGRKIQVIQISRSLTIRILSYTSYYHIRPTGSSNCLSYFRTIFFPPVIIRISNIRHSRFIDNIFRTKLVA